MKHISQSITANRWRWRRKVTVPSSSASSTAALSFNSVHFMFCKPLVLSLLLVLLLVGFFFSTSPLGSSNSFIPTSSSSPSSSSSSSSLMKNQLRIKCKEGGERFLFYAPHSGFSNQLSEFRNAIIMAGILNRTLIVPPILDHHSVILGSCPKFRVTSPGDLRSRVLDHIVELLDERRYIAITDVVDLSSLQSSSLIKIVDFRVFISTWCGSKEDLNCSSISENTNQCRSLFSGLPTKLSNCTYAVEEDCTTTVWTYQQGDDGVLDSYQPDKKLLEKKKVRFNRRHRDVSIALGRPGSEAETATVLSFGSLFSSPYRGSHSYVSIKPPKEIEFLPFTPEITSAGKNYASKVIKHPFLCAQLRLLDGRFKNMWESTFKMLKTKIESLQRTNHRIDIFLMTDLSKLNWTGTYISELANDPDSFKLHTLNPDDEILLQTVKNVRAANHGLKSSIRYGNFIRESDTCGLMEMMLPDISLYLEETICSCASLGFVGTSGSTITQNIDIMRKNHNCINSNTS